MGDGGMKRHLRFPEVVGGPRAVMGDPKETIGHHGQELPVRWCFSKGTVRGQALPVALFPVRSSQRGHAAPLTATGPARLSLLPLKRPFYPILTRDALYVPCLFILAGDAPFLFFI